MLHDSLNAVLEAPSTNGSVIFKFKDTEYL